MSIDFMNCVWRRHLLKPFKVAMAVGFATALVTLFMPNYYKSEARILPVDAKGSGGNLGGLAAAAAAFGVSVPGADGGDTNYVDILQSRWMAESLLKSEFTFHVRSWRFGSEKPRRETLYAYLDAKNLDRAVAITRSILSASKDAKTKILIISAETRSPDLSRQLVQKSTGLLEQFVQEKGRTRGGYKAAFAEARLKESRGELAQAEEEFRRFLDANRNYMASADASVRLKGTRLDAEFKLKQQMVNMLATNREQALMEEKNDMPILNVLDPANLPLDKSRPRRSIIVLVTSLISALVVWAWLNREWIREWLLEDDEGTVSQRGEL